MVRVPVLLTGVLRFGLGLCATSLRLSRLEAAAVAAVGDAANERCSTARANTDNAHGEFPTRVVSAFDDAIA